MAKVKKEEEKVISITGWACSSCGELYDNEDSAQDCCPNYANEVEDCYQCTECDSVYKNEEDAERCCNE